MLGPLLGGLRERFRRVTDQLLPGGRAHRRNDPQNRRFIRFMLNRGFRFGDFPLDVLVRGRLNIEQPIQISRSGAFGRRRDGHGELEQLVEE